MDPVVEEWIRRHVEPTGPVELVHDRPWAKVTRVPTADRIVWFKACAPVQAFEPRLSAQLSERWPDRVAEVIGHDEDRAWLLMVDAGQPVGAVGNPPESWLRALPRYAELQLGETAHAGDHLRHGVPDLRLDTLPDRYADLLRRALPLDDHEIIRMRRFTDRFRGLVEDLAVHGVPETIQHDDLHMGNLFAQGSEARILDWGDSSISHPFASLVVTFRFLEERNGLPPSDPWFERLRDAYLEPWGTGLRDTFTLAMQVGSIAHAIAWLRQRDALAPAARPEFDTGFSVVLRRALRPMDSA
jgi:Phosphotransferase enzyme family